MLHTEYLASALPSESEISASSRSAKDLGPCVYFLLKDGRVVYVGQSTLGMVRTTHHRNAKDFDSFAVFPFPREELDARESLFIERFRPPLNRSAGRLSVLEALAKLGVIDVEATSPWKPRRVSLASSAETVPAPIPDTSANAPRPQRRNALLRLTEVATIIGFSRRWLEMQVANGLAPTVRVGRSVRMRRADVDAFVRDGKWPEGKAAKS